MDEKLMKELVDIADKPKLCAMCNSPLTGKLKVVCLDCRKAYYAEKKRIRDKERRQKEQAERLLRLNGKRSNGPVFRESRLELTEQEAKWLGKPKANVFKDPKLNEELEKEAAALGMSYGEIQSHRYIGDLATVVARKKNGLKGDNIYKSFIGGGGHGAKGIKI